MLGSFGWVPIDFRPRCSEDLEPFFFTFCLVTILGGFWMPGGTPKSTKNRFFAKKGTLGSSFLTIFAARGVFFDFFIDFRAILA